MAKKIEMALPLGTILQKRYRVINVLGGGGFGIVYGVTDIKKNNSLYAIKEYYPRDLCIRDNDKISIIPLSDDRKRHFEKGETRFLEEAEMLEKFQHVRNIVSIHDFFQENGTCYFVMENLAGQTLGQYVKRLREKGGSPSWKQIAPIVYEVGKALSIVHKKGVFHRDIKPGNIFLLDNGTVKLIDFGLAKSLSLNESLSVHLTKGFAAPEQYSSKGNQGTWTDVYGFASTIYFVLSGNLPPEPVFDPSDKKRIPLAKYGFPEQISDAVENALEFDYRKRIQTIDQFMRDLGLIKENDINDSKSVTETVSKKSRVVPVIITRVNGKEDFYELKPNVTYRLGRSPSSSNIVLDEPHVSKYHCDLFYDELEKNYYVVDHSSTGIYVGNTRIRKGEIIPVRVGQVLYFGSFLCQIEVGVYEQ